MKFKNILCPLDFSESGEAALFHAASLAKEYDAELHLVHIYERPFAYVEGGFAGAVPPGNVPPADLDSEKAKLDALKPAEGVRFRRDFIVGDPVPDLVDYVDKNGIDLVVMGTHGRTGLSRLLMGSVAEGVVRRASCPVLTIRQPVLEKTA